MQVNIKVSEEIQVFNKVEASHEETAKQVKPSSWHSTEGGKDKT